MAKIYQRGQHIIFRESFRDSSGDLASPSSVSLIVSYPSSGWPYRAGTESTTIAMVQSTEGSTHADYLTWSATWASGSAYPGPVHWHMRTSNLAYSVKDGEIILRGNPANLLNVSTT